MRALVLLLLGGVAIVAVAMNRLAHDGTVRALPAAASDPPSDRNRGNPDMDSTQDDQPAGTEPVLATATFGNGCFWCTEAVFQQIRGVESVTSGYSGGQVPNPTYEAVCTGRTGHAEVIQITYDPQVVSFAELLEVFWGTHDPTTLNRQGADVGTQYRSAVFYHDEEQRQTAEAYRDKLDQAGVFDRPIVTEITPFEQVYPAEEHHQNFYALNKRNPYCSAVIGPKMAKLKKVFADRLKE